MEKGLSIFKRVLCLIFCVLGEVCLLYALHLSPENIRESILISLIPIANIFNKEQTLYTILLVLGLMLTVLSIVLFIFDMRKKKATVHSSIGIYLPIVMIAITTILACITLFSPSFKYYSVVEVDSNVLKSFEFEYRCDEVFDGVPVIVIRKYSKDDSYFVESYDEFSLRGKTLYGKLYHEDDRKDYVIMPEFEVKGLFAECEDANGEYLLIDWYRTGLFGVFVLANLASISVLLINLILNQKQKNNYLKDENGSDNEPLNEQ